MNGIQNELLSCIAYPVLSTLFQVFCTLLSSLRLYGRGLKAVGLDNLSPNFVILRPPPTAIEIRLIALLMNLSQNSP